MATDSSVLVLFANYRIQGPKAASLLCALFLMFSLSFGCTNPVTTPGKAPERQLATATCRTVANLPPPATAGATSLEEKNGLRLPAANLPLEAMVPASSLEPIAATPVDYIALLSRTLDPGETPNHPLVRGDLGDMKNIALLMTYRSNKSSKQYMSFGGVLAVPGPNGPVTRRLPELRDEGCEFVPEQLLAVAFVQADEDSERELVVIATYSSGAGVGGVKEFHCNRVIDWNGERFVFLTEVEQRVGTARTVSDVRQVLGRTRGKPTSHSAFAAMLARHPVSRARVIEDSNGETIGRQVTLERPLTVGRIRCRVGRMLRTYASTWGCVVDGDVTVSGHTAAAGTWAEFYYATWGLAYFALDSFGAEPRTGKSRTVEGVSCRAAVLLAADGSISGCTLAAPFRAADEQGTFGAGTEVRFWDSLTVAAAWLHKPHTLQGKLFASGFVAFNERGELDERFDGPSWRRNPRPIDDNILPDGQRLRDAR